MNRIGREHLIEGRNTPAAPSRLLLHRRDGGLAGGRPAAGKEDENLDLELFSKTRVSISGGGGSVLVGSDDRDEAGKVVEAAKIRKSRIDDLLEVDMGKHDYDWLLTPPGSPPFPPSVVGESTVPASTPNRSSSVRSISNTRSSRLSTSQTENGQSIRPVRSSSVTRASVSSHITNNGGTLALNTRSTSVTSRSVTPGRRPATPSSAKTSTPVTRPMAARTSTPSKSRPTSSSSGRKAATPQNSRPATPQNSRSATPTRRPVSSSSFFVSSTARLSSRPSTPTRQPITRAATPSPMGRSPSVGRLSTSTIQARQSAPSSRPSSPSLRPRAPVMPIDLPDFPNNAPPNLRTKLPERPVFAGRSRPGMTLPPRSNSNTVTTPPSVARRITLPIVARSKFPENAPKAPHSNGIQSQPPEIQKPAQSDAVIQRLNKTASVTGSTGKTASVTSSTGFGRTISKKSMDMALRHMDIRQSMGAIRGASLYPQSIRSAPPKVRSVGIADPVVPISSDDNLAENDDCNGTISSSGSLSNAIHPIARLSEKEGMLTEYNNEIDPNGSSYNYDLLLKEDYKDTNWLHTVDDKSDQSSLFDHRFEPLLEPFDRI